MIPMRYQITAEIGWDSLACPNFDLAKFIREIALRGVDIPDNFF